MNRIRADAYCALGTVIIVANEGSTIDIPNGSILENVVVQGSLRLVQLQLPTDGFLTVYRLLEH